MTRKILQTRNILNKENIRPGKYEVKKILDRETLQRLEILHKQILDNLILDKKNIK